MHWKFTHIHHQVRIAMGISLNAYSIFDIIYKSQTHPDFTVDGWAKNSYREIGRFLGISPGTVFNIIDKGVKDGFIEVDHANPDLKRTTENWYNYAYIENPESNILASVQKLNVQKLNARCSENERGCSKIERKCSENEHYNINKENLKENLKENIADLKKSAVHPPIQKEPLSGIPAYGKEENGYLEADEIKKEKNSAKKEKRGFKKPDMQELISCFQVKMKEKEFSGWENLGILEAEKFFNYYESIGWCVGKKKMVSWTHAVGGWISRIKTESKNGKDWKNSPRKPVADNDQRLREIKAARDRGEQVFVIGAEGFE